MEVLWPSDRVVRAALFVGLGLGFWQQASGSEAAVYYSPHVLEVSGGMQEVKSSASRCGSRAWGSECPGRDLACSRCGSRVSCFA